MTASGGRSEKANILQNETILLPRNCRHLFSANPQNVFLKVDMGTKNYTYIFYSIEQDYFKQVSFSKMAWSKGCSLAIQMCNREISMYVPTGIMQYAEWSEMLCIDGMMAIHACVGYGAWFLPIWVSQSIYAII